MNHVSVIECVNVNCEMKPKKKKKGHSSKRVTVTYINDGMRKTLVVTCTLIQRLSLG